MRARPYLLVCCWSLALSLAVCAPFLWPGFVLTYDMVWVPTWDLSRPEWWGLGDALPRAVPSDGLLAVVTLVIPAQLAQPLILIGALFFAGAGLGRLLNGARLVPRLAGVTLYVWNPFVAERLMVGHWPLLIAYAALPWLVIAVRDRRRNGLLIGTLAAMALTPVTGMMSVLVGLVLGRRQRWLRLILTAVALNAPWIIAGALHLGSYATDPAAVRLFEVQPEGYLGRLGAALSLGGIWNTEVVPVSRTLFTTLVVALVLWAVMVIGAVGAWRRARNETLRLIVLAALGLTVALSGWLATDAIVWLSDTVPGAAMLRDGTRWLMLLALVQAVFFAAGLEAVMRTIETRWASWVVGLSLMLLPIGVLPDLAWGAAGRLTPVDYPASWSEARDAISDSGVRGDIVVLPFEAYRAPSWNEERPVLDPAGRFFDRRTVVNDVLVVSGQVIAGEDRRAARIARILEGEAVEAELAEEGIGLVVVAPARPVPVRGEVIYRSAEIRVIALEERVSGSYTPPMQTLGLGLGWGLALIAVSSASWPVRSVAGGRRPAAGDADPT